MKNSIAIVWFRNDLRLHDHEPLAQALERFERVVPVYCFDPRNFRKNSIGLPKTGAFRAKFLLESVADLKASLQDKGSDLVVRYGSPEKEIAKIAKQLGTNDVFAYKAVTKEEAKVESALKVFLGKRKLKLFSGNTLIVKEDLPYRISALPDIFTEFKRTVEGKKLIRQPIGPPQKMPALPEGLDVGSIPSLEVLKLQEPVKTDKSFMKFKGGETAGIKRLKEYLWDTGAIQTYKDTRNHLLGQNYSSKLSPWLAVGALSPRFLYSEVKRYESEVMKNDSTFWLIYELLWRDYFQFVAMKYGKKLMRSGGIKGIAGPWRHDKELFTSWKEGKTGVPFIDANMRELNTTGYMSNRGRQNVASFLVKDLNVDWRMGAAYFESKLIDYDYATNWGNWNYIAGVGNDPRENRYFNVLLQALRYDPNGDYVRHWLPELNAIQSSKVHQVFRLTKHEQKQFDIHLGSNYPWAITMPAAWIQYY
jgi:deoxyribodipyrimidine photo-lyase